MKRGEIMKKVTLSQFMLLDPCYSEEQIIDIIGDKKEMTALEVLDLDIPAEDRLWAVLREEFIDASILHEFACRCAEEALKLVYKPEPQIVAVIEAKRKWIRGEIFESELTAARDAAWNTARNAAWNTARDATWNAVRNAAWNAVRDAVRSASSAAARSTLRATVRAVAFAAVSAVKSVEEKEAVWEAAWDAANAAQIAMLKTLLKEEMR